MKKFNIVVSGLGGQGIITLAKLLTKAAFLQGKDVKMSELHGLSQRMGHAESHVVFGNKIYSSLVNQGDADLIIALEPLEALRVCHFASKKTILLLNDYKLVPISVYSDKKEYPSQDYIMKTLKQVFKEVIIVKASDIVKKETGAIESTNVYMLGYAFSKGILPLKKEFLGQSIKEIIKRRKEINNKIFELACVRGDSNPHH